MGRTRTDEFRKDAVRIARPGTDAGRGSFANHERARVDRLMRQNGISVVTLPAVVCLQTMRGAQTQGYD